MMQEGILPPELSNRIPADVLPDLEAWIAQRDAVFNQRFAQYDQRIAAPEERLNKNSSNSSKPPSSDGPEVKRAPPKKKSKRKRGGQPGHTKKERVILPPTQTVDCKPTVCSECQVGLSGSDPNPDLFQYIDLPSIQPTVIHYRLHRLECRCGCETRGRVPEGIVGHDGPGVQAMVVTLLSRHQSRRQTAEFLWTVCGVPMSTGKVCKIQDQTTKMLASTVEAVRTEIRKENANIDETGLRQSNRRGWLWVAVTVWYAAFWVRLSRGRDVFVEIVGENFQKICTTDRLKTYHHLSILLHQFCWAHLLRDFQAMVDRKNRASPIGKRLLKHSKAMFALWFRVRDGTLSRKKFRQQVQPIRRRILKALSDGQFAGCAKTRACCASLFDNEEKMWAFLDHKGVEPTNNAAERALRKAAIWRRIMLGTQSESGNRFVETILTVWETCCKQGKNSYEFLRNAFEAASRNESIPSLIVSGA